MTPKTVVILDTGREWGGGTNSMIELVKRIDRRRYALTALFYEDYSRGGGSTIKAELEALGVEFTKISRPAMPSYSKAVREGARAALFFSQTLKKRFIFSRDYRERIAPAATHIAGVLKEKGADMLYLNNQPSSNLEGIIAAGSLGLPCVQHSRVQVRLNSAEAEAVNAAVSKVICVSNGVRDALIESGVDKDRCVVVYNGIDKNVRPGRDEKAARESLGIAAGAFLVGTAGSLLKRKRTELLIDAMPFLKKAGKDVVCLIIGDGPEMDRLKARAKKLGVSQSVVFAGFSNDAFTLINCLDVLVLPSAGEGLPRVVLEAMLLSKPVVAFDVSGVREVVDNGVTGIILKEVSGRAVSEAVGGLMDDKALRKAMGNAAKARVLGDFAVEKYVEGVMRVFDEVLH